MVLATVNAPRVVDQSMPVLATVVTGPIWVPESAR